MAPARLNDELRKSFPESIARGLERRQQGIETESQVRFRIARLIATLCDTHDWTDKSRAIASGVFL